MTEQKPIAVEMLSAFFPPRPLRDREVKHLYLWTSKKKSECRSLWGEGEDGGGCGGGRERKRYESCIDVALYHPPIDLNQV